MDEFLDQLVEGYEFGRVKSTGLAFADDLVLSHSTPEGLERMLRQAEAFFQSKGMSFNPKKCRTISMLKAKRRKTLKVITNRPFQLHGADIKQLSIVDAVKYLGLYYDARGRIRSDFSDVETWCLRVKKAQLKPQQKLVMVRQFIIPRMLYRFRVGRVTMTQLREVDRIIRRSVRTMLHLRHDLPAELFYNSAHESQVAPKYAQVC